MPENPRRKLAFIAGGIGITPFRSMVKYLVDRGEKRDAILFYSNRNADEIAYRDVFPFRSCILKSVLFAIFHKSIFLQRRLQQVSVTMLL